MISFGRRLPARPALGAGRADHHRSCRRGCATSVVDRHARLTLSPTTRSIVVTPAAASGFGGTEPDRVARPRGAARSLPSRRRRVRLGRASSAAQLGLAKDTSPAPSASCVPPASSTPRSAAPTPAPTTPAATASSSRPASRSSTATPRCAPRPSRSASSPSRSSPEAPRHEPERSSTHSGMNRQVPTSGREWRCGRAAGDDAARVERPATAAYYTQYLTAAPGEVPGVWSGRQADRPRPVRRGRRRVVGDAAVRP